MGDLPYYNGINMKNKMKRYHTVETVPISTCRIVEKEKKLASYETKLILLTHNYLSTDCRGLVRDKPDTY
jgi:hypothetical protein